MLGPVAGRGERGDHDFAEADVAVGERLVLVGDARLGRDVDSGTGCVRQPSVAGHVVGVIVRLQHVVDAEPVLLREGEVLLDLPGSMTAAVPPSANTYDAHPRSSCSTCRKNIRRGSYVVLSLGNA